MGTRAIVLEAVFLPKLSKFHRLHDITPHSINSCFAWNDRPALIEVLVLQLRQESASPIKVRLHIQLPHSPPLPYAPLSPGMPGRPSSRSSYSNCAKR